MLVAAIGVLSTAGYVSAGWSLADAAYMVILTIFSVGYGEVRPIDTPFLRTITITTIALGCTAMILLTGALVQYLTAAQLRRLLGLDRMQAQIERLSDHVVICGFGRIGVQLSKELHLARRPFVVIERDLTRCAQAQAEGYLHINGEATDEDALRAAGIAKARILATVLPDDAANVFITLSARNMNPGLEIIARGEVPTTESKLYHAGADRVVLPTHIGAERIAEMILYPATADYMANSAELNEMKRGLHEFGLELEMVEAAERGALTGETVGEAERLSNGAFFILHPTEDVRIEAGDRIALLVRGSRVSAGALFTQRQSGGRTGRMRL